MEERLDNTIIIKYCLPLSVVSFIIFLCGFFFEDLLKTSLWAAVFFIILASLTIYCYTSESITNQTTKEIEKLKRKSEKIPRIHYGLHLINPKKKLSDKVFFCFKTSS